MVRTRRAPTVRQLSRFAVFVALVGSGIAAASHAEALEPTYAQRMACTPDAFRLCSDQIPSAEAVRACMIAKKSQLSSGCRAMFNQASASR